LHKGAKYEKERTENQSESGIKPSAFGTGTRSLLAFYREQRASEKVYRQRKNHGSKCEMRINCEKINKEVGIGVATAAGAIKHARAKINYLYHDNKNLNERQWQAVLELQSIITSIELNEQPDEQPTKAEDILRYWKKYDYIFTEYTSAAGKKCYRTVGLQAYYAALCRRFRLNFEFLGDFYYIAKGDGFSLEYVEGDIILAIENKEEGENK
jgi:hypothetical protein